MALTDGDDKLIITKSELEAIADAIRVKTGQSGDLTYPNGFVSAINSISGGSYTVTVSLTNPVNPSEFSSIDVMLVSSNSEQSVIRYLEQINSPTGSKVYEVEPSAYGILIFPNGASPAMGTSSCTGNITLASDTGYSAIYHVTGNGTITIDGIDYDD